MELRKYKLSSILLGAILLVACEKKELRAPKYDRGDVVTMQVAMTANYKNQIWYSLSDNTVVSTNLKTAWDLGFESNAAGFHITLNSSKVMRAFKTNYTALSQVTDTLGLAVNQIPDMPSGNLDSTAIGNWQISNSVYIINLGYSETGQKLGYYKLKVLSVSSTQFTFEYGSVFGNIIYTGTVDKNDEHSLNMYSLVTHQQIKVQPKKLDYDLCFTQYSHVYTNPIQYYQVTGVLSNASYTRILRIQDQPFNDISINDTVGKIFSKAQNTIGFNWKFFNLNTNLFTVDPTICFIIQDGKGFYYKLHFIDFYNETGLKGYPKFEFLKL